MDRGNHQIPFFPYSLLLSLALPFLWITLPSIPTPPPSTLPSYSLPNTFSPITLSYHSLLLLSPVTPLFLSPITPSSSSLAFLFPLPPSPKLSHFVLSPVKRRPCESGI